MIAVSFYSGIGGLDLAAHYAGFDILAQVEMDEFCRKVLTYHARQYWPRAAQYVLDSDMGRHNLPDRPDLLFGGFPCQPFSSAGLRKGSADHRNRWPELCRVIGEIRPRAILLENVRSIAAPYKDKDGAIQPAYAGVVAAALSEMGYVHRSGIVSAADAGAGHLRERWWLVAYAAGSGDERSRGDLAEQAGTPKDDGAESGSRGEIVGDPTNIRCEGHHPLPTGDGALKGDSRDAESARGSEPLADALSDRRQTASTAEENGDDTEWNHAIRQRQGAAEYNPNLSSGAVLVNPGGAGQQECQFAQISGSERYPAGRSRPAGGNSIHQSRMGIDASRFPDWLVEYRRPALQGEPQHEWEPPRTIPKAEALNDPHYRNKVKAIGNAVFVPTAFALMLGIRMQLEQMQ